MTRLDLDSLAAIAAAATPGPWYASRPGVRYEEGDHVFSKREPDEEGSHDIATHCWGREEAQYIAALNPAVVLALIQELRDERTMRRMDTGHVADLEAKIAGIDAGFQQLHWGCNDPDHGEGYNAIAKALGYAGVKAA